MKKVLCFLLALPMLLSIQAITNEPAFSNLRTYGGSAEDYAYRAFPLPDDGFLMYGYSRSDDGDLQDQKIVDPNHNAWAFGINEAGDIQWQVVMGEPGMMDDFGSAIDMGDGRYALVREIYRDDNELSELVILDANGKVGNTIQLPGGRIRAIAAHGDRYYALGWDTEDDSSKPQGYTHVSHIACLDVSGKVLWERNFSEEGYEDAYLEYMVQTEGGVIACGSALPDDDNRVCILAKYNETGDVVWTTTLQRDLGIVIERLIPVEDGGAILLGESLFGEIPLSRAGFAVRIDKNGSVVWEKEYKKDEQNYLKDIIPVEGGFLVVSQTDAGLENRWPFAENCWLFMINDEGEIIAETTIDAAWPEKLEISALAKDAKGKLYIVGQMYDEDSSDDITMMEIQEPKIP